MMQGTRGALIAAGRVAEIFTWGPRVLKLYRSPAAKRVAFREAAIHAAVEALGLPVPAVWGVEEVDGRWGIVLDRVRAAPLAERIRQDPACLEILVRLHHRIHGHATPWLGSLKMRLAVGIRHAPRLEEPLRQSLLHGLAAMPDGDRLCHGDFHPMNVLGDPAQPVVIDWSDACCGAPAADACRSYLLLTLHAADLAEPYLDAYCRVSTMQRAVILGWLPYVAAARLAEDVAGEGETLLQLARSS